MALMEKTRCVPGLQNLCPMCPTLTFLKRFFTKTRCVPCVPQFDKKSIQQRNYRFSCVPEKTPGTHAGKPVNKGFGPLLGKTRCVPRFRAGTHHKRFNDAGLKRFVSHVSLNFYMSKWDKENIGVIYAYIKSIKPIIPISQ